VPSPQSAQKAPAHPLWLRTQQLAQYPGMPLLLRAHSGAAGLGLLHVYVPVRCLLGGDRRKNRVRAEPPSYAGDNTAAPGRSTFSDGLSGGSQSIFPKRNMSFLHLGEVRVDFGDLWIGLALCHSSVLGSAVNFVLPIFPIAFDISSLQHIFILSKCDTDVSARPLAAQASAIQSCFEMHYRLLINCGSSSNLSALHCQSSRFRWGREKYRRTHSTWLAARRFASQRRLVRNIFLAERCGAVHRRR